MCKTGLCSSDLQYKLVTLMCESLSLALSRMPDSLLNIETLLPPELVTCPSLLNGHCLQSFSRRLGEGPQALVLPICSSSRQTMYLCFEMLVIIANGTQKSTNKFGVQV